MKFNSLLTNNTRHVKKEKKKERSQFLGITYLCLSCYQNFLSGFFAKMKILLFFYSICNHRPCLSGSGILDTTYGESLDFSVYTFT